jgi:hypothetical protein
VLVGRGNWTDAGQRKASRMTDRRRTLANARRSWTEVLAADGTRPDADGGVGTKIDIH